MRLLFLAGSLLFAGCEESSSQLIEFETTNSPCLDAMMVNMRSTLCQNIDVDVDDSGISHYQCSDESAIDSSWNRYKFITVSRESYYSYEDLQNKRIPFCEDPNLVMFLDD